MRGCYLLDTAVFSQPLRRKPVHAALARWQETGDARCAISIVTEGEVLWGLHLENRQERWEKYRGILENRLSVLPAGPDVWHRFAAMKARQQAMGQIVDDFDLLIAATAVVGQWTVATLNRRDFSRIEGIVWEDWSSLD